MSAKDQDRVAAIHAPSPDDWSTPLTYWREFAAEMYDASLREEVRDCTRRIKSTIAEWNAAVNGNAEAAVKIALKMRMPVELDTRHDLVMTTLLNSAFHDAKAASVMADLVQLAPLDPVDCMGIATSWRVHKIYLESVALNAHKRRCSRERGGSL